MTLAVPPGSFSHVIWPETAVPYDVSSDPRLAAWLAAAVPEGGLLFTGALRRGGEPGEPPILWNSLHAIDASGSLSATYDKQHLVPFGEYMPLRSIMSFAKLTHGNVDFSAGPGAQTLTVPGLPSFSPLICYEAIFPALSEERGRARKFDPPVVSSGNLTPFGKGERAIEFEDLAAAKMAFLVKMVVDRSVDRNELLERFRTPEFRHRTLSPAKRLV